MGKTLSTVLCIIRCEHENWICSSLRTLVLVTLILLNGGVFVEICRRITHIYKQTQMPMIEQVFTEDIENDLFNIAVYFISVHCQEKMCICAYVQVYHYICTVSARHSLAVCRINCYYNMHQKSTHLMVKQCRGLR